MRWVGFFISSNRSSLCKQLPLLINFNRSNITVSKYWYIIYVICTMQFRQLSLTLVEIERFRQLSGHTCIPVNHHPNFFLLISHHFYNIQYSSLILYGHACDCQVGQSWRLACLWSPHARSFGSPNLPGHRKVESTSCSLNHHQGHHHAHEIHQQQQHNNHKQLKIIIMTISTMTALSAPSHQAMRIPGIRSFTSGWYKVFTSCKHQYHE